MLIIHSAQRLKHLISKRFPEICIHSAVFLMFIEFLRHDQDINGSTLDFRHICDSGIVIKILSCLVRHQILRHTDFCIFILCSQCLQNILFHLLRVIIPCIHHRNGKHRLHLCVPVNIHSQTDSADDKKHAQHMYLIIHPDILKLLTCSHSLQFLFFDPAAFLLRQICFVGHLRIQYTLIVSVTAGLRSVL